MRRVVLFFILVCAALAVGRPAVAQTGPVLAWVTNSSIRLQQLIGVQGLTNRTVTYATDTDRQTGSNLLNRTYGLYQVGGTNLGFSFEYNGRVNFRFGDTLYLSAGDTMAWSTSTNPLTGLLLNFFTNSSYHDLNLAGLTIGGNVPTNTETGGLLAMRYYRLRATP